MLVGQDLKLAAEEPDTDRVTGRAPGSVAAAAAAAGASGCFELPFALLTRSAHARSNSAAFTAGMLPPA